MINLVEYNDSKLKEEIQIFRNELKKISDKITAKRNKTSKFLKETIEKELKELGIKNIQFETRIEKIDFSEKGQDKVVFYMSPNVGEELKPLAEIVSGVDALNSGSFSVAPGNGDFGIASKMPVVCTDVRGRPLLIRASAACTAVLVIPRAHAFSILSATLPTSILPQTSCPIGAPQIMRMGGLGSETRFRSPGRGNLVSARRSGVYLTNSAACHKMIL